MSVSFHQGEDGLYIHGIVLVPYLPVPTPVRRRPMKSDGAAKQYEVIDL